MSGTGGAWAWRGGEAALVRGILRALHLHCLQHCQAGWKTLERTALWLRWASGRSLAA